MVTLQRFIKSHAVVRATNSLEQTRYPSPQEGIRANRALLNEFAREMQPSKIRETPALQTLCDLAEQFSACAAAGVATAYLLYSSKTQRQQIETQWAEANSSASADHRWSLVKELIDGFISATNESKGRTRQVMRTSNIVQQHRIRGNALRASSLRPLMADVSLQTELAGLTFDVPFFISHHRWGLTTAKPTFSHLGSWNGHGNGDWFDENYRDFLKVQKASRWFARRIKRHLCTGNEICALQRWAAKRAVDIIEANAIQIHVNRAQNLWCRGDRVFSNWLKNIEENHQSECCSRYRQRSRIWLPSHN